jgi:adenine-specific DNA-methyltransferase
VDGVDKQSGARSKARSPEPDGDTRLQVRSALKRLGKFYTPDAVAKALVDWAVRSSDDRVLDPSYGGCAFFAAARARLKLLGAAVPERQLFGVDIDPEAMTHLNALLNGTRPTANFRTADFLHTRPAVFGKAMQAIVGNPPYVRHHALTDEQLALARAALATTKYTLDGRASYWAYFVLHALQFLKPGGRLAMVLPTSLLNADYAVTVRRALSEQFALVRMAVVAKRMFEHVDEASVIVLADGYSGGPARCAFSLVESASDLPSWCLDSTSPLTALTLGPDAACWKQSLLPLASREALAQSAVWPGVTTLGDLAKIRIGTVTGANRFFVLSGNDIQRHRLPESVLVWVLDSGSRLEGLEVNLPSLRKALADGHRVKLFRPAGHLSSRRALAYVATALGEAAARAGHCQTREPWYVVRDSAPPDAFLSYVNHRVPRLALNTAGAACTNAVHRLWWKRPRSRRDQRLIALSFLSSLSGLSAELYGRSYGGGVLKLEVAEAAAVRVALPNADFTDLDVAFNDARRYLRAGNWNRARYTADEAVLVRGVGLSREVVSTLAAAQDALHSFRLEAKGIIE